MLGGPEEVGGKLVGRGLDPDPGSHDLEALSAPGEGVSPEGLF
mgnify:CR=1 FL=1